MEITFRLIIDQVNQKILHCVLEWECAIKPKELICLTNLSRVIISDCPYSVPYIRIKKI